MGEPTITLTREQRHAIYTEIDSHVYGRTDGYLDAILAPELAPYLELARQLRSGDPRAAEFVVTLPAAELAACLGEQIADIDEYLADETKNIADGPQEEADRRQWPEFVANSQECIANGLEHRAQLVAVLESMGGSAR